MTRRVSDRNRQTIYEAEGWIVESFRHRLDESRTELRWAICRVIGDTVANVSWRPTEAEAFAVVAKLAGNHVVEALKGTAPCGQ